MSDWKNETCRTCEFYGSIPVGRCYRYPPSQMTPSDYYLTYPAIKWDTPACAEYKTQTERE